MKYLLAVIAERNDVRKSSLNFDSPLSRHTREILSDVRKLRNRISKDGFGVKAKNECAADGGGGFGFFE